MTINKTGITNQNLKLFIGLINLLIVFSISLQAQVNSKPTADFSGVNEFWKIVESLEKNIEPLESEWSDLFKTKSYTYMTKVNLREPVFKKCFPLVFMPSKSEDLKTELTKDNWYAKYYLPHYLVVKEKKKELIAFQKELEKSDLLKKSLMMSAKFLPKGTIEKYPHPSISFAIFEPDAYGSSSYGIIIDLLLATRINLTEIIAHEAHHYYIQKLENIKKPTKDKDDYYLIHAINQLRLEGSADLIDKADILDLSSRKEKDPQKQKMRSDYRNLYGQAADAFGKIDLLISEIADTPTKLKENSKKIWDLLPNAGHPQGFYMSRTIVENLGKNTLIKNTANPFDFIRTYNLAAQKARKSKKSQSYVFSEKTMGFLNQLELNYIP